MRPDRLRALREAANLSQEELALEIDSSEPMIQRYEKGSHKPGVDVLLRLAQYFHVSSDYLLGLSDNPNVSIDPQLRPVEAAAIDAWRKGEKIAAIKEIVNDD